MSLTHRLLFFSILILSGGSLPASCSPGPSFTPTHVVTLDSLPAAEAITTDRKDHFFAAIGLLDMSLQLKTTWPDTLSRPVALEHYQESLRQSVQSFPPQEAQRLSEWTQDCIQMIREIAPSIVPDTIRLIRVDGKAYGDYTFYTREKCIIIPAEAARNLPEQPCKQVLMHELFHIISRYHPELRRELYALIGFYPISKPVTLDSTLIPTRLLNPDGIDMNWGIQLSPKGLPSLRAQIVIHARYPAFLPRRPQFFNYLKTSLFAMEETDQGWTVGPLDQPLSKPYWEAFNAQIGDNTDYIIHPDEIMADNFVYTLMPAAKPNPSAAGKQLLQQIREVLAQY
jgi:hypothetical protein